MDKHLVIVIGASAQRDELFAAWAASEDPWFVRMDVERVDVDSAHELTAEQLKHATVLGDTAPAQADEHLSDDPWLAMQEAFERWPDRDQRLRQLRLHHLRQAWPAQLLPSSADTQPRVLGYFLRVHA